MTGSENSNARILAGECFCRAVRYEVEDTFAYALNCHCSNCRRTTGSAFKPFAGIMREKLSVTRGGDNLTIYGDKANHDAHCGRRRVRPCRNGNAGRCALDPAGCPHLCRLQGAMVCDHRRSAAISGTPRARPSARPRGIGARRRVYGRSGNPAGKHHPLRRTAGALARLTKRQERDSRPRGS
jgi:hypothetical protein